MNKQSLRLASAATLAIFAFVGSANAAEFTSPLNVRSGPGGKWPVVATIPTGAEVEILGCASGWRHYWCKVQSGEVRGYVHATALQPSGNQLSVAPVVTTDPANMRARPSLFAPIEEVIPGGGVVNVIHCAAGFGRGWCKISYEDKTGYVRGGLLARQTY